MDASCRKCAGTGELDAGSAGQYLGDYAQQRSLEMERFILAKLADSRRNNDHYRRGKKPHLRIYFFDIVRRQLQHH
jgi:hypothetical protein